MRFLTLTFGTENARAIKTTEHQQFLKVVEEFAEFVDAVTHRRWDDAREEAVDLMRALDGWIAKQPDDAMRATVRAVQLKEQRRGDSD